MSNDNNKLKVAVIGVGSWANRVHIPQVLSHDGAQLVGLCARTEQKLKAAGEEFDVQRLYTDYEELIAQDDIDAVTISTTHDAHYRIAKAALQRGLHVFCEKPLGLDSKQTGELAGLAEEAGVKTMVAFTNRWVPEAKYCKQLMDDGFCGEVFHYNVLQLAGYALPDRDWIWRADPHMAGGGVLFDLGCHNIDLAIWLNGPIRRLCATLKTTAPRREKGGEMVPTPVDDTDAIIAQFEKGSQGIFHISWTCPGDRTMRHEIAGRDGRIRLNLYHDIWINSLSALRTGEDHLQKMTVPDELQGQIPRQAETQQQREEARHAFLTKYPSLVCAFIDCIIHDTDDAPNFADGHATQQVMDAILDSDARGRWIEIGE